MMTPRTHGPTRLLSAALLAIPLGACATGPMSFQGIAPPGREAAYQCAVAQLNIMGYTIEDGNEDAGFVRGRKQTSGFTTEVLTGETRYSVLTATVFDVPANGQTILRVVAIEIAAYRVDMVREEEERPPSDAGQSDSRSLLYNCGVTDVMGTGGEEDGYSLEGAVQPDPATQPNR